MSTHFSRHRTTWALVAIALAVLALGLWSIERPANAADKGKGKRGDEGPVAITSTLVKQQDVPIYRTGIGTVTPTYSVTVKARVDGQLDRVAFTEGQDVRKGQLLAQLDPRTLQAQLLQAQAAKAKDQATLANARVDLKRYETLIAQDAATQQQLDTQKALVNQLDAGVKADEAAVNAAQVQLGFTTITAPISGRVGARLVDPGNIVHAADTTGLVVINQIDPISVVFTLPDDAVQETIHALDSNKPVLVQAFPRDGGNMLGAGYLTLLNNQIDTSTGTVQLKASFINGQHNLWPGQYVNVRLILGTRSKALTVPEQAVQRSQSGVYVYVVDEQTGTVQSRTIALTQIQDGIAVISSGVNANDRVVVDGQYKLKPGSKVMEAAKAASGTASGARK
ncbi:MAG TPA: efflux RND transporter periplasmic adaptor subunit [Burkholderiaceae bacterium]